MFKNLQAESYDFRIIPPPEMLYSSYQYHIENPCWKIHNRKEF